MHFLSWSDFIWYKYSHPLHHKAVHAYDGEVYLPQKFNFSRWRVEWNPLTTLALIVKWWRVQHVDGAWNQSTT